MSAGESVDTVAIVRKLDKSEPQIVTIWYIIHSMDATAGVDEHCLCNVQQCCKCQFSLYLGEFPLSSGTLPHGVNLPVATVCYRP